ncbi:hypothetical protein [Streptomyces sp. CC224B]|uniref:hypothetical protein n=1 Tax=Streptomyces sp. CC224B TaxID=3044571 RepID=UPI0024A83692|nr:hypothetical protein [Streptomyces sp. CC224B]
MPAAAPEEVTAAVAEQAPTGIVDWVAKGVTAAINAFFKSVVSAALNPLLELLGDTLLTTPEPDGIPRIGELWTDSWKITLAAYGVLIMVAGILLMGYQSVQTRYSVRELGPRIPLGFLTAGLSLPLASQAVELANALSTAVLGPGLDEDSAGTALRDFVLHSFTSDSGIFIILLLGVVAVLLVALLVTYIVRVALTILLIAGAPLALMCHALPQTDGIARWWWRVFAGLLAIQVAQSMALVVGIRVFLTPGTFSPFGREQNDLVSVLVSLALMYILVKIPFWILGSARVGHGRSFTGRLVRAAVAYKAFGLLRGRPVRAAAAGHAGWGGRGGPGVAAAHRRTAVPAAAMPATRRRSAGAGTPRRGGRTGAGRLRPPGPPLFLAPNQPGQAPGQGSPPPAGGHTPGPPPMPVFLAPGGQSGASSAPARVPSAPAPARPSFRPPATPSPTATHPLPRRVHPPAAPLFQEPRFQPPPAPFPRAARPPAPTTFRPPSPGNSAPPHTEPPPRSRGDR